MEGPEIPAPAPDHAQDLLLRILCHNVLHDHPMGSDVSNVDELDELSHGKVAREACGEFRREVMGRR